MFCVFFCLSRCNNPANHKDFKKSSGASFIRYDKKKGGLVVIVS